MSRNLGLNDLNPVGILGARLAPKCPVFGGNILLEQIGKPAFTQRQTMKLALCDPEAFYPLRNLVSGPLRSLDDLSAIERFVRTVLLHDEIAMELTPSSYDPETDFEFTEEDKQAGARLVITALEPVMHFWRTSISA